MFGKCYTSHAPLKHHSTYLHIKASEIIHYRETCSIYLTQDFNLFIYETPFYMAYLFNILHNHFRLSTCLLKQFQSKGESQEVLLFTDM